MPATGSSGKGPVRRLEAESIRDACSPWRGCCSPTPAARASRRLDHAQQWHDLLRAGQRGREACFYRTVYRFSPRGDRPALLESFDCPDPSSTAPKRSVTTTPLQSLSLLNNAFVLRLAELLADRVAAEAGESLDAQVDQAWRPAIGRLPTADERALSLQLVARHGLPALCRGLFNITEFVVID